MCVRAATGFNLPEPSEPAIIGPLTLLLDGGPPPAFPLAALLHHLVALREDELCMFTIVALSQLAQTLRYREAALRQGLVSPVVALIVQRPAVAMLRACVCLLLVLTEGEPPAPFAEFEASLPALASLLLSQDEPTVLTTCHILASLSAGSPSEVERVATSGVCRPLVELLSHQSVPVRVHALRTVANIASGDWTCVALLLACSVVPALRPSLYHASPELNFEACWALSNILGSHHSAGASSGRCARPALPRSSSELRLLATVASKERILPRLLGLCDHTDARVRTNAVWAMLNLITQLSSVPSAAFDMRPLGFVRPICGAFTSADVAMVYGALRALDALLASAYLHSREGCAMPACPTCPGYSYSLVICRREFCSVVEAVFECSGVADLESLQHHPNASIHKAALSVLATYFDLEPDAFSPHGAGSESESLSSPVEMQSSPPDESDAALLRHSDYIDVPAL